MARIQALRAELADYMAKRRDLEREISMYQSVGDYDLDQDDELKVYDDLISSTIGSIRRALYP